MRYTRYEKKNNNKGTNKFVFLLVLMLAIALILGSFIFNTILQGTDSQNDDGNTNISEKDDENSYKCYTIQCGSYSSKENAEVLKEKLKDKYIAFVVEEASTYKVMISLYEDDDKAETAIKDLNDNGISSFKVTFGIPDENNNKIALRETVKGYIKILDKLNEKDIKAVKTSDFKKWSEGISPEEGNGKDKVEELKQHIEELPDEVNNKDLQSSYEFLSKILIEYKIK